jgi:hypothetical protein
MSRGPVALALAVLLTVGGSCTADPRETIEVEEGLQIEDVLAIELYTPYERGDLLRNPEEVNGAPNSRGLTGDRDQVAYSEYVGELGRIRVLFETWSNPYNGGAQTWLEVFPGALYLRELLKDRYLNGIPIRDDEWTLDIRSEDPRRYLVVQLDGDAVVHIADIEPGS